MFFNQALWSIWAHRRGLLHETNEMTGFVGLHGTPFHKFPLCPSSTGLTPSIFFRQKINWHLTEWKIKIPSFNTQIDLIDKIFSSDFSTFQVWNIRIGIYAKYQVLIMLLFVYTT